MENPFKPHVAEVDVRKKIPLNLTKDIPSNTLIPTLRSTEGQSVEGFGKSSYGIVGAFGGVAGGVAISNDGGKTFESNAVSVLDANHPVRYGAYPTADTWFVSAGSWPSNSNFGSDEKTVLIKQVSETIQVRQDRKTGEVFYHYINPKELRSNPSSNNITAYHAAITKTT
jgi:hypothetical protein